MEGKGLISSILHTSPRRQARHESRLCRCHISQAETSWSSLRVPKRSTRNRDPWREGRGRPCPITLFSGMDTDSLPDRRGHTSSCRRWWPTSAFRPGARRGHSTPPRPRSGLPPPGRLQRLLPALMALAPRPAQSSPGPHRPSPTPSNGQGRDSGPRAGWAGASASASHRHRTRVRSVRWGHRGPLSWLAVPTRARAPSRGRWL